MSKIYLSNCQKYCLVDDEDYDFLSHWTWYLSHNGYAIYRHVIDGKKKTLRMHRLVNGTPDGVITDHINGDKLDNRRSNLRDATKSLNAINSVVRKNNISGARGVSWIKRDNKWRARIKIEGQEVNLGHFEKFQDAVKARKKAEEELWPLQLRSSV